MSISAPLRRAWRGIKYRGYGQGWLNRASRRRFEAQRPALGETQARVVEDLRRDGFARAEVRELIPHLWEEAAEAGRAFVAGERVRRGIEAYRPEAGKGKDYIVKLWDSRPSVPLDDPWLRIGLSPALLDTVNSYLGLWSKLNYVDAWYTIPSPLERQAVASQRWHRDPEDQRLVKAFLYLSNVDEGAGPLQYVRGSHGQGRHARLWPNPDPGTASYPPEGEVEAKIPVEDRVVCTGPAGTLVFCDTYGLHRGGLATERPRVLATWAFVTPASIFARRFEVAGTPSLGEAAEFALR
ncbi:MAG TPA: phytanoyl-CoA dioxygenase family protein [Thermoanaerobaculia bacterium]|nr:phytanoyl-CoA dioxygenase family protein [Thermoanaerobaculia bacterium]